MSKVIAQNVFAADGNFDVDIDPHNQRDYTIYVDGDFGIAGSLTIEADPDGTGVFTDTGETAITAAGIIKLSIEGHTLRFVLAGSTTPALRVSVVI